MTPYNNYYQTPYINTPYNPYQPNMPQISQMQTGQQPQPQAQAPMQIQNGGFVSVRSIEDAQRYAVAPGNAVTFKIEGAPIVCEKSQGFSQLEAPRFEVFDLVKREIPTNSYDPQINSENIPTQQNTPNYLLKEEMQPLKQEIDILKQEIAFLKEQLNQTAPKKTTAKVKKEDKEGEEV